MEHFQPVTFNVPDVHNRTVEWWDTTLIFVFVFLAVAAIMLAFHGRGKIALVSAVIAFVTFCGFVGGWFRVDTPWPDRLTSSELGVAVNEQIGYHNWASLTVHPGGQGFTVMNLDGYCEGDMETNYTEGTVTLTPNPGNCTATFGWKPFVDELERRHGVK